MRQGIAVAMLVVLLLLLTRSQCAEWVTDDHMRFGFAQCIKACNDMYK